MKKSRSEFAFLGGMREDYCITHDDIAIRGVIGGNAVYSAVGARIWVSPVSLLSRVGINYPQKWIDELQQEGIITTDVKILDDPQNTCTFYAYLSPEERVDTNPTSHFRRVNQPIPKTLIDYQSSTDGQESREIFGPLALRPSDLPRTMGNAIAVHLAPADYLSHATIPQMLQESGVKIMTLDPSIRYMDPSFRWDLPTIVHGLDAFLPSDQEARSYFTEYKMDVWEMAEAFGDMGARFVIIKRGPGGQCLWDKNAKQRWQIPAYAAQVRDVTGAGDSFCGGFIVGLSQTGDPVESALMGSVSASLTIEGSGALYALGAAPGLKEARLEYLRGGVKRI
ncbi:MAG: carbohydrate kinase family protein [Anaerolineales bacterium]